MTTLRPEDIPDEWVALAIRANADRNHDNLCACVTWPEQCASGYTPDQWEHGDEACTIAAVTPEIQRRERERVAAEILAACAEREQRTPDGQPVATPGTPQGVMRRLERRAQAERDAQIARRLS